MDYSYKKQALKTFWVGVDKYFKIYPVFSAPGTHLYCDTFSPWKVFLICTPQHQVGNSRLASHFSCQFLVFKTPSPRNFQLSFVGWVWMFSRTANYRQRVLNWDMTSQSFDTFPFTLNPPENVNYWAPSHWSNQWEYSPTQEQNSEGGVGLEQKSPWLAQRQSKLHFRM